jgi:hypothetical protein
VLADALRGGPQLAEVGRDREASRRIHVEQILGAEVQHGRLIVDEAAVLELRLVDGQELMVPFTAAARTALERLVAVLPARI